MKVLNIIVAAAASMALMAACSSKTGSAAAEASQNDTVAVAAPAEAVIEVAAGDTALSFSTPLAVIDFNATWCVSVPAVQACIPQGGCQICRPYNILLGRYRFVPRARSAVSGAVHPADHGYQRRLCGGQPDRLDVGG